MFDELLFEIDANELSNQMQSTKMQSKFQFNCILIGQSPMPYVLQSV